MKRILIIILNIIFVMSCTTTTEETIPPESLSYLALGDSYTIGQSVPEEDRFPVILAKKLNALGIKTAQPRIIARTGWTTDELKAAILDSAINRTYDRVSLLIGVNNQFRGRDTAEYRIQYADLLNMAIEFAKEDPKNVFVVSIPDWGVSPFASGRDLEQIAKEIDVFNAIKLEETNKRGVTFVDITDISRQAKNNADLIASDNLHFSGKMHELWVDEIITTYFRR